jgi:hypothetical protein
MDEEFEKRRAEYLRQVGLWNEVVNLFTDYKEVEDYFLSRLRSRDEDVQSWVVKHPKATEKVLLRALEVVRNPNVRIHLVDNPNVTDVVLHQLIMSEPDFVRRAALCHPRAPLRDIVSTMRDHPYRDMRECAAHVMIERLCEKIESLEARLAELGDL